MFSWFLCYVLIVTENGTFIIYWEYKRKYEGYTVSTLMLSLISSLMSFLWQKMQQPLMVKYVGLSLTLVTLVSDKWPWNGAEILNVLVEWDLISKMDRISVQGRGLCRNGEINNQLNARNTQLALSRIEKMFLDFEVWFDLKLIWMFLEVRCAINVKYIPRNMHTVCIANSVHIY